MAEQAPECRHISGILAVVQLAMNIRLIVIHARRSGDVGSCQTILAALWVYTDVIGIKVQRTQATHDVVMTPLQSSYSRIACRDTAIERQNAWARHLRSKLRSVTDYACALPDPIRRTSLLA